MSDTSSYNVGDILNPGLIADNSSYSSNSSNPGGRGGWYSERTTIKLNDGTTVVVDEDGTILQIK